MVRVIGAHEGEGAAIKGADNAGVGVEFIEAGFDDAGGDAVLGDEQHVLFEELQDFDHRLALGEAHLGTGEVGGDHLQGAAVAEAQEGAGGEQHFRTAFLIGGKKLPLTHGLRADGVGVNGAPVDGCRAFDVVDGAGDGPCLGENGGREQGRQRQNESDPREPHTLFPPLI
ncbi:MAG TPA: hypothetical protein DGA22_03390 [Acidobacterium sp.]|nr:hypothetical protein [Acidobacterium sp.]